MQISCFRIDFTHIYEHKHKKGISNNGCTLICNKNIYKKKNSIKTKKIKAMYSLNGKSQCNLMCYVIFYSKSIDDIEIYNVKLFR